MAPRTHRGQSTEHKHRVQVPRRLRQVMMKSLKSTHCMTEESSWLQTSPTIKVLESQIFDDSQQKNAGKMAENGRKWQKNAAKKNEELDQGLLFLDSHTHSQSSHWSLIASSSTVRNGTNQGLAANSGERERVDAFIIIVMIGN